MVRARLGEQYELLRIIEGKYMEKEAMPCKRSFLLTCLFRISPIYDTKLVVLDGFPKKVYSTTPPLLFLSNVATGVEYTFLLYNNIFK